MHYFSMHTNCSMKIRWGECSGITHQSTWERWFASPSLLWSWLLRTPLLIPSEFTYESVISACTKLDYLVQGMQVCESEISLLLVQAFPFLLSFFPYELCNWSDSWDMWFPRWDIFGWMTLGYHWIFLVSIDLKQGLGCDQCREFQNCYMTVP